MTTYTDDTVVEALIKNAIGYGSTPELSVGQIAQLVSIAMPDGTGTSETLQRSASSGWAWKAGLTADQYDLEAASGAALTRDQWFAHCMAMARAYADGALSVDGGSLGNDLTNGSRNGAPYMPELTPVEWR